jgi:DNA-directed RNA polymerase subunit L
MNPTINNVSKNNNSLLFTLSGVNVSIANGLRRTIISDIPIVVFETTPYERNKANIISNTSRFNNEILKQRLSCIPIHIKDLEMPLENYIMEVEVENNSDTIMYVTTEEFKIKNITTNEYLSNKDTREIFPPNLDTGYYIDFVRLRPRISDDIPGEKIHLTCKFSISTAKVDGTYNVASTLAYGFTQDKANIEIALAKKKQEWKDQGMTKEENIFQEKNWRILDAHRIIIKDSFDFIIESIGVFTNEELTQKGCTILIDKLKNFDNLILDKLNIIQSDNTMTNSYDIILVNEDYTLGKILEYFLYSKYYEGDKSLTYCGFKKMHPHDTESIIRLAYDKPVEIIDIKQNLKECVVDAINIYSQIFKKIK